MTITPAHARPSRPSAVHLRPEDLGGLASVGLRTRKLRAALSALGISIGVAAIVAVLGLAASSPAGLLAEIAQLGTNLLTVTNGPDITGQPAELPKAAPGMVGALHGVTAVQYTGALSNVNAYRSPYIPTIQTNALSVDASSSGLPRVSTSMAQGTYLNAATENEPVAVLGYQAAQRLGIDRLLLGEKIWVGGMWFYVVGILNPAALTPEIDSSVLIGFPAAEKYLHFDGHPSELYVRTQDTQSATTAVDNLLGYQAYPQDPSAVDVSQPSSALTARAEAGRRVQHAVPWPGSGRAAGRRDRRGQHHDHLGAGTASGDRAAAGAGRYPGPDTHPVSIGGHPALAARRRRRGVPRRDLNRALRP